MAEAPVGWALPLADWLVTYGLHSTLALGAVWGAERAGLLRRPETRDVLWKSALVIGLVTASLRVGMDAPKALPPPGASLLHGLETGRSPAAEIEEVRRHVARAAPASVSGVGTGGRQAVEARLHAPTNACLAALRSSRSFDPASVDRLRRRCDADVWRGALPGLLLGLWVAGAALFLLVEAVRRRRLRVLLRRRHRIDRGRARRLLDEMSAESGIRGAVRLYWVDGLGSPAVIGPNAIGVPSRIRELESEELAAALGHELAHLARGDRIWLGLARLVSAVGFVQPLNRLALRRLEETAELLADDWAVRRIGNPLGLARTLTRVAGWVSDSRPTPALSMASARSPLDLRVERLLDGSGQARRPRGRLVVASVLFCLMIGLLPGLSLPPASVIRVETGGVSSELAEAAPDGESRSVRVLIEAADR